MRATFARAGLAIAAAGAVGAAGLAAAQAPSGHGGGIYLVEGAVTLNASTVKWNTVNNCSGGSIAGC